MITEKSERANNELWNQLTPAVQERMIEAARWIEYHGAQAATEANRMTRKLEMKRDTAAALGGRQMADAINRLLGSPDLAAFVRQKASKRETDGQGG